MRSNQDYAVRRRDAPHGHHGTPIYFVWRGMLNRCTDPSARDYRFYGGRGIKVCRRWYDFRNFLADMGERQQGLTLDRINSNGNYRPSNCRWATWKTQHQNMRRGKTINLLGIVGTMTGISRKLGIDRTTLSRRVKLGLSDCELTMQPTPRGSLSVKDVADIRRLFDSGEKRQYELVKIYNVTAAHISNVVLRKVCTGPGYIHPANPKRR